MFKRVSEVAEQVANGVSRRAFLGRLGQGALVAAGVLGALVAIPPRAQAGPRLKCCIYESPCRNICTTGGCKKKHGSCNLVRVVEVPTCDVCGNFEF